MPAFSYDQSPWTSYYTHLTFDLFVLAPPFESSSASFCPPSTCSSSFSELPVFWRANLHWIFWDAPVSFRRLSSIWGPFLFVSCVNRCVTFWDSPRQPPSADSSKFYSILCWCWSVWRSCRESCPVFCADSLPFLSVSTPPRTAWWCAPFVSWKLYWPWNPPGSWNL